MEVLLVVLRSINAVSWLLLFVYGMHYYLVCALFLRKRKQHRLPCPLDLADKDKPLVAIQLPIYNEIYVVERLIENIGRIRWPREKLEIQVLDDSTDETTDIAQRVIRRLRRTGLNISLIRRPDREGAKAGALKYGIEQTKAEYLAIFDSDFLPEPDFLEQTMPYLLARDSYAFVQTRWGHVNREFSPFTYAQSLGIDGHFIIEQGARNMNGLWMNFNGTAGVWRRQAILEAGNWAGDTLTEDLDLSYRAQLKGWECLFLSDVVCPAEIPVQILPYKTQQFRWAKGSIQTAKKLLRTVLRAKTTLKRKLEAVVHLTYYSIQFLMVFNLLTLFPLVLSNKVKLDISLIAPFMLYSVTTLAPITLTLIAQNQLRNKLRKTLRALPYMFAIGFGISVHIAIAFLEAMFNKKSFFIRTPKLNVVNRAEEQNSFSKQKYRIRHSYVLYLEMFFALFCFVEAWLIALRGHWVFVQFPLMMGFSLCYVIYRTLHDAFMMRRVQFA